MQFICTKISSPKHKIKLNLHMLK